MTLLALLLLMTLLALANGANDNCKGVATLVGYGAATPRKALLWAMISTAAGAGVSFWLAAELFNRFSGGGLFAGDTSLDNAFFAAVLIGAFGWVMLATITGMPVSTTHAIAGALTGAGLMTFGATTVNWSVLGTRFATPLALSPLLATTGVYLLAWPLAFVVSRCAARCVCAADGMPIPSGAGAAFAAGAPAVVVASESECRLAGATPIATTSSIANAIHWFSSGLVGFARGWNDAPKIAALGIGAFAAAGVAHGPAIAFAVVTLAMAAGGMVAGRKVLDTLSRKLTPLPLAESLTASLTTAALVSLASWRGLPVSTTHVSTGAIVGAGLKRDPRGVRWGKVGEIVISWLLTLPIAGLLAASAAWLLR